MHAIYVDESGTPEESGGTACFAVVGLSLPLSEWKTCDSQMRSVLKKHGMDGVELHSAWMARYYPEQERIFGFISATPGARREMVIEERKKDLAKASLAGTHSVKSLKKNYDKTSSYIHLTHSERLSALREVAETIGSWEFARLFGEARMKKLVGREQNARSREEALEQITTRFELYLSKVHGSSALGIMIHDQHQAASVRLTSLFRAWQENGTSYAGIPHIVETPLFVDSSLTTMVQAADLAAYATRRFFENAETDLFDRIYSRFDRNSAGKLVGLRHFTGKAPCTCRVCLDHRRSLNEAPGNY